MNALQVENYNDDDDDDLIIIKKVLQKGNHIHRLTALLEHGKFRAGHYPLYLVFFGGFSLTQMLPE